MELSKYHCMIGKSEAVCSVMLGGGGEKEGKKVLKRAYVF